MNNYPIIPNSTQVIVWRTVTAFRETNQLGPKTIACAMRDGDMTNSSGTVSVRVEIVDGPHAGANAWTDGGGVWVAQYNPLIERPDGTPLQPDDKWERIEAEMRDMDERWAANNRSD